MTNALEAVLRAEGLAYRVEVHDRLAIVTPDGPEPSLAANRRRLVDLARAAGFTHVAVELDPSGATVPRD